MQNGTTLRFIALLIIVVICAGLAASVAALSTPSLYTLASMPPLADDPNPPTDTVKLVFIHHSCGENWLGDGNGGLGIALRGNNYFVSDTNYGWGPDGIGDRTDITDWPEWFRGPHSSTYLSALYTEYGDHSYNYSRLTDPDPGRENEIIMFKSCFPNSNLEGNPDDPPAPGAGLTVSNAKYIYNDLLSYFTTRQDKLFVVITAPPVQDPTYAANARAFNTWLVEDWLYDYSHNNVAVFDFYNVLTDPDNHHRFHNGAIEYINDRGGDTLYYPTGDDHPSSTGNQKASAEFVPLLNVFFHRWRGGAAAPSLTLTSPNGGESWQVNNQHQIRWNTAGTVSHVSLAYSTDGFTTTHLITSMVTNTGLCTWTTPLTPTNSARVRVASVVSPTTVCDISDSDFTLYDPSTFTNTVYLPIVLRNYTPSTPTDGTPIQPADLVYQGAFRLPDAPGTPENVGWEWGGSAMTYYPDGDPDGPSDGTPGSIFGSGHDQTQYVSEIKIPVPIISSDKDVDDLNTAETLQDFYDIRGNLYDGRFEAWEIPRAGLAYLPKQGSQTTDKLHFCWGVHMQEGDTGPSHGWCELDLSAPQSAGIWRIGGYWNYATTDYLFDIPQSWADTYTPGKYLATGRFRDGGQGGEGPSLFAYGLNEGTPPTSGTLLSATPLLLYGTAYEDNPPTMNNYHHSDEWSGGAWLTASDKSAVIFVGTKGQGDCWYGCADGTYEPPWPDDCDRGWWSTSFVGQILFYDPADLAAVAQGGMETWEPQPYVTLEIDEYLYHIESSQQKYHVGAASFDRERGLLYVFEPLADGDKPLVHVWRVDG